MIALNDANYDASNPDIGTYPALQNGFGRSEKTTTNKTESFQTEATVTQTFGAGFTVEFGGVGVSGSTEFSFEKSLETTNTESTSTATEFSFVLQDNEANELNETIEVRVERDSSFGSPIFKLEPFAKTSCPYEGGYQRDQPKINADSPSALTRPIWKWSALTIL